MLLGLAFAATLAASTPPRASVTQRVVVDPVNGLAIYGVDPVAYFTSGKPVLGREDFEYRYAGTVWRFDNMGNRAAFAASPDVYMPQFGGYDPLGVARGVATPGYTELWTIAGNRLFLFYSKDAREAFMANAPQAIAAAEAKWPALKSELVQ